MLIWLPRCLKCPVSTGRLLVLIIILCSYTHILYSLQQGQKVISLISMVLKKLRLEIISHWIKEYCKSLVQWIFISLIRFLPWQCVTRQTQGNVIHVAEVVQSSQREWIYPVNWKLNEWEHMLHRLTTGNNTTDIFFFKKLRTILEDWRKMSH